MTTAVSNDLTLETLSKMFRDHGVERLFLKRLAPNDNYKNQIYLGGELSVLRVIPTGKLTLARSASGKPGERGRQILKSRVLWSWLDATGCAHPAPNAQLVLYPQYPEVRFSGFLQGCGIPLGKWLDPARDGRLPGRILLIGVGRDGQAFGHLVVPGSVLARQLESSKELDTFGALTELEFLAGDNLARLLAELKRIHLLGWITGKRIGRDGNSLPCNSRNCGGYTLEAELGISPNGLAEPDYLGWEVKSFTVDNFEKLHSHTITLMTPEPDGGLYRTAGPEAFIRKFGYPDVSGKEDRINFGGVHRFGEKHGRTGLTLTLTEYDFETSKIRDVSGGLALFSGTQCAASWSFRKLIEHWKRKHDKAAYVANQSEIGPPRRYSYANAVNLGQGAEFTRFLAAFTRGTLYYDPGLKLERASTEAPRMKRRNQFRVRMGDLTSLYGNFRNVPL